MFYYIFQLPAYFQHDDGITIMLEESFYVKK